MRKERFRDLRVWTANIVLARSIYRLTAQLPREERFGLSQQLRRAAVSVPSNIAEGSVRSSRKDFKRFVEIAIGSLVEIETQLEIAQEFPLSATDREAIESQVQQVRRMLYRLYNALGAEVAIASSLTREKSPHDL